MNIDIRTATEADTDAIVSLMRDFAEYEKLSAYLEVTGPKLHAAMFGPKAFVEGIIAYAETQAVAYALFYPNFASFRGQLGYYLEDLYIHDDFRGIGLGETILKLIAKRGRERGFKRIDFQVLEWNESAVRFYEKRGAVRDDDERHYRFIDEAFDDLAS